MFIKAKISHDRINGNHYQFFILIENILRSSREVNLFHDKYSHLKGNVNKCYNKHSWITLLFKEKY